MFGISWGGFQGIQTAYRAPPELKAVIAQSFAPDRYRYSQVFRGGCVLLRSIRWSSQLFGYKSRPPDPAARRRTLARDVDGAARARHAADRRGTQAPDVRQVLARARDRLRQHQGAVLRGQRLGRRRLRRLGRRVAGKARRRRRKGLIGPWGHRFAPSRHAGSRDRLPAGIAALVRSLDARQGHRASRASPSSIAWMPRSVPAKNYYAESPGRWVAEEQWPSPRIKTQRFFLNAGRHARDKRGTRGARSWKSPQTLGLAVRRADAVVPARAESRAARRSAHRRRPVALLRQRAAQDRISRYSARRPRTSFCRSIARSRSSACACATSRPTAHRRASRTRSSTSTHVQRARRRRYASSPAVEYKVRVPADRRGVFLREGASHPRRRIDDVLAAHLALAGACHAHARRRKQLDRAAGAAAHAKRRHAAEVQAAGIRAARSPGRR